MQGQNTCLVGETYGTPKPSLRKPENATNNKKRTPLKPSTSSKTRLEAAESVPTGKGLANPQCQEEYTGLIFV